jgi:branched-chain amino acid aminotransferase
MATVPFDDRDGVIWWDGALVPWREARLHVLSHGLHYATSVFEGERAYRGVVFRLREHTERLLNSARLLGFEIPFTAEAIEAACHQVLAANGLTDAYVRPIAWRGTEQLAVSPKGTRIHLAIACWEWPHVFGADPMAGMRLALARWRRPHPNTMPVQAKASGLYMIGSMAKGEAEAEGWDDALMLDWRGQVAEATGANIFFAFDGELHTPTPECFLDGITRQAVIGLARERQITVVERPILPEEIGKANEVFITGTAAEVTSVRQIGELHFAPGPMTEALIGDFRRLVRGAASPAPSDA